MVDSQAPRTAPAVDLHLQTKVQVTQRLIMSQYMQQAIHLLQAPLVDLRSFIEEQVTANPLLDTFEEHDQEEDKEEFSLTVPEEERANQDFETEISISDQDFAVLKRLDEEFYDYVNEGQSLNLKRTSEEDKLKNYLDHSICADVTLYDHLMQQARDSFESERDLEAVKILIGYMDESGLLKTPLNEIAYFHGLSEADLEKVLIEIQTFEPYGVGAPTIRESLLIQLQCLNKKETLAYQIIEQCYDHLLHNRIPLIAKKLRQPVEFIQNAIARDIVKLNLHPGQHFRLQKTQFIIPDVNLRQEGEHLIVEVNRDYAPTLRLNHRYLKMLEDPGVSPTTKSFIKQHIFSARWLARNLQQRYSTVERIAAALANKQYEFFTNPEGKLVPLTMKALAQELNLHESTIARTVSNKYLNSPRGLMALRAFFTHGYQSEKGEDLSAQTIRDAILNIITQEDKLKPLSDESISKLLKEKGMACARRTVAKYRTMLNLGNMLQRKKF